VAEALLVGGCQSPKAAKRPWPPIKAKGVAPGTPLQRQSMAWPVLKPALLEPFCRLPPAMTSCAGLQFCASKVCYRRKHGVRYTVFVTRRTAQAGRIAKCAARTEGGLLLARAYFFSQPFGIEPRVDSGPESSGDVDGPDP